MFSNMTKVVECNIWALRHRYAWKELLMFFWNKELSSWQNLGIFNTTWMNLDSIDLSIGSTETKYIKLNIKTQNIFCRLNENLTTFSYTLTGWTRKQKEKKFSLLKCLQKLNVILKNLGFSI